MKVISTLSDKEKEDLASLQEAYAYMSKRVALKQTAAEKLMSRPHCGWQVRRFRDGLHVTDDDLLEAIFAAKKAKYFSKSPNFEACAGEMFDKFSDLRKDTWHVHLTLNGDRERNQIVKAFCSCLAFASSFKALRPIANKLWITPPLPRPES